jgi:hypothetical protein
MSPPRPLSSDHPTSTSSFQALEEALAASSSAPALGPDLELAPYFERLALLDLPQMEAELIGWCRRTRIREAQRAVRELGEWPRPRQLTRPRFVLVEGGECV